MVVLLVSFFVPEPVECTVCQKGPQRSHEFPTHSCLLNGVFRIGHAEPQAPALLSLDMEVAEYVCVNVKLRV
jgi:hypothetical protein